MTLTLRNVVRAYFEYGRAEPTFYRLLWSMRFAPPDSEPYRAALRLHQEQLALLQQLFRQAAEHQRRDVEALVARLAGDRIAHGLHLVGLRQLEAGNRLARLVNHRLPDGDTGHVIDGMLHHLAVGNGLANNDYPKSADYI
mgnify:CR=1 FL=1